MADFMDQMRQELNRDDSNKVYSENGAVMYASTGKNLIDFLYAANSLRNKPEAEVMARFERCYIEDPMLAVKMLFEMGDVRGGKGERRTFDRGMEFLAQAHPEIAKALIPLIPEYTRWDHMAMLVRSKNAAVRAFATQCIVEQLKKDAETVRLIEADKDNPNAPHREVSLCAKWMPSISSGKNNKQQHTYKGIATAIAYAMGREKYPDIMNNRAHQGLAKKEYRKLLAAIRPHLNIAQIKLSRGEQLTESDLEKMSAGTMLKVKEGLKRNAGESYDTYLEKVESGEAKMNTGALTPADIVHQYSTSARWHVTVGSYDKTLELQYQQLPAVNLSKTIVVRDDSGSMTCTCGKETSMTCLEVATAMAIFFADHLDGPYKGKFISFSERPKYLDISGFDSLHDKLAYAYEHSEVANTNIEATFDLILRTAVKNHLTQDEIPECVLIFSDCEFDAQVENATTGTWRHPVKNLALFDGIKEKWAEAGYTMPTCAFWNLNVNRALIPSVDERGVVLLSGYSTNNIEAAMNGELSPWQQFLAQVNNERYDAVEDAFKEGLLAERTEDSKHPRKVVSYLGALDDDKDYVRVDAHTVDEEEYSDEYSDDERYDDDGEIF